MAKVSVWGIFLLVNGVALFCAFNPWFPRWQGQGVVVLGLEVTLFMLVGLPMILYQCVVRRKTFRQSLSDTVQAVMDFISHFSLEFPGPFSRNII